MFSRQEFRQNLLGCFEIMIFMRQGVWRFSESRRDAIRSFFWPVVILPLVLFTFSFHSTGYSLTLLMVLHTARIIITTALFLGAVYFVCRHWNREKHFCQFVTAVNWLNIPLVILLLPAVVPLFGAAGPDASVMFDAITNNFQSYAIFMACLGYVYTAFVMTHALRVPWELAGAITIVGLGIDQTMMDATVLLRDYIAAV